MTFRRSVSLRSYGGVKSQDIENFFDFFAFFGKTTPCGKIFKILFRRFSSWPRSTCCVQISWNLADGKSAKSCVIYLTKNKISRGSPALATVQIAPKICHGQLPTMYSVSECSSFLRHRFTFGGVIFERVNTVRARSKVNPVFGWSITSSRIVSRAFTREGRGESKNRLTVKTWRV